MWIRGYMAETMKLTMPILEGRDDKTNLSTQELYDLQQIITPRHVLNIKVVITPEEVTDEETIFIEDIPLLDRFAITLHVLGFGTSSLDKVKQEQEKLNQDREQERLKKFLDEKNSDTTSSSE